MKLTKREYFAAKAMQSLLSNPEYMKLYEGEKYLMKKEIIAQQAITYADEILSIINKESFLNNDNETRK